MALGLLPQPKKNLGLVPSIPRPVRPPTWGSKIRGTDIDATKIPGSADAKDLSEGLYKAIAAATGGSVDLIRRTAIGQPKGQDPWKSYNAVIDAMESQDLVSRKDFDRNEFAENVGTDLLVTAFTAGAGGVITAGKIAATTVAPHIAGAIPKVGRFIQKTAQEMFSKPKSFLASEAGGSVGTTQGQKVSEGTDWEIPAQMAGGVLFGAVPGGLVPGATTQHAITKATVPNEPLIAPMDQGRKPFSSSPLAPDYSLAPQIIAQQVDQSITDINTEITGAINNITGRVSGGRFASSKVSIREPIDSARRFRTFVRKSENKARVQEETLWEGIDPARLMAFPELTKAYTHAVSDAVLYPHKYPADMMKAIKTIIDQPQASLGTFMGQGSIRSIALDTLRRSPDPNIREAVNNIQDAIFKDVERAFPGDQSILAARRYSVWLNDRFHRPGSPLSPAFGRDVEHDALAWVNDVKARENGAEEVNDVSATMRMPSLVTQYTQVLKDQFRAMVDTATKGLDPEEAQKAAAKMLGTTEYRQALDQLPQQAASLRFGAENLERMIANKETIRTGALSVVAGQDIGKTVTGIFGQAEKAGPVKQIVGIIEAYPEPIMRNSAMQGLQHVLITELQVQAGGSPAGMLTLLMRSDYKDAFKAAMGPQYDRFAKIVSDAAAIQNNEVGFRKVLRKPLSVGASVLGAMAGRTMNTGTIQVPGKLSGWFGNIANQIAGIPDPAKTLTRAFLDPRYEKLMRATLPTNRREATKYLRLMQLTGVNLETAGHELMSAIQEDAIGGEVRVPKQINYTR